jgi:hypothetical protein
MNSKPGKICFYIIISDTGLAPNPFHGFCTLSLCTPNHMRARLVKGDWIVGCFRSGQPPRFVYVMQIDEALSLAEYYGNPRYTCKKPSGNNWKTKVGDNIYYLNHNGLFQQDSNALFHHDMASQTKDKRGNRTFIGRKFVYLGRNAISLPPTFYNCLPATQGIKYLRSKDPLYQQFINWSNTLAKGYKGDPRDREISIVNNFARGCR